MSNLDTNIYAYVATDHDSDGVTDAVYSVETFTEQGYFKADEAVGVTRETFEAYIFPMMNAWERSYWEREGFCSSLDGKRFRLPRDLPTVEGDNPTCTRPGCGRPVTAAQGARGGLCVACVGRLVPSNGGWVVR